MRVMNKRLNQTSSERLALLRFPLIVGIVFIHNFDTQVSLVNSTFGISEPSFFSEFVRVVISRGVACIAVPLFFLMAGYFFFLNFSLTIKNYIKKLQLRAKTLLVPFLFWNVFTLGLLFSAQSLPATRKYFSGKNPLIETFGAWEFLNSIFGFTHWPIAYQFWFIRDLIVLVFLTPIIYLLIKYLPKVFTGVVLVLWFFHLWPVHVPAILAFAFFYAGAYFAFSNISLFTLDRFGPIILGCYAIVVLIDSLSKGKPFNVYVYNFGILLGIPAALFLTKYLIEMPRTKTVLLWAEGCSFFVFAVHEPLISILRKLAYRAISPSTDLEILVLYFALPFLVIGLALVAYKVMQSISPGFLSIISGGRAKSRYFTSNECV